MLEEPVSWFVVMLKYLGPIVKFKPTQKFNGTFRTHFLFLVIWLVLCKAKASQIIEKRFCVLKVLAIISQPPSTPSKSSLFNNHFEIKKAFLKVYCNNTYEFPEFTPNLFMKWRNTSFVEYVKTFVCCKIWNNNI